MQAEEIRQLSDAEVVARLAELEREQFNLRFRAASQPLEEPLRLRSIRRDIARLKTVQRQRALGVDKPAAAATAAPATAAKKTGAKRATAKKAAVRTPRA